MGTGTDVAMGSAQVALVKGDLLSIGAVHRLAAVADGRGAGDRPELRVGRYQGAERRGDTMRAPDGWQCRPLADTPSLVKGNTP